MEEEEEKQSVNQESNQKTTKKGRVIIRNLVFDIKENHLKKLLEPYGEIKEIQIPMNLEKGLAKGFAFVEFANKNKALRCIKELNGSTFKGRTLTLDLSVQKEKYNEFMKNLNGNTQGSIKTADDNIHEKEQDESGDDKKLITKNLKNKESQKKMKNNEENSQENKELKTEKKNWLVKRANPTQENKNVEEGNQSKSKKKYDDDEGMQRTVFVKNIDITINDSKFKKYMKGLGTFEYAVLVKDKNNPDINVGTGFVRFVDKDFAEKLTEHSRLLDKGEPILPLKHIDLKLGSSRLSIMPALTRNDLLGRKEWRKDKEAFTKDPIEKFIRNDKNNKRKLELLRLGLHRSDDVEDMTPEDANKRERHLQEILTMLSNPNYFASETRVLLKNLPKKISTKNYIKDLVFELLKDKLGEKINKKKIIKNLKFEEQEGKLAEDGRPLMKGFGFIEFVDSEDALEFVKQLVIKWKDYFTEKKVPIVQFALYDIRRKIKLENNYKKKQLEKTEEMTDSAKGEADKQKNQERSIKNQNLKSLIKISVEKIEKGESLTNEELEKLKTNLHNLTSRGFKQRFKRKLKGLGYNFDEKLQKRSSSIKKITKDKVIKKEKPDKKIYKTNKQNEGNTSLEEKYIVKKMKLKKKNFKKSQDKKINKLDEFEAKHLQNAKKKSQWFNKG